ncbi:MAG: MMPL family transporter [Myxococcota bacterium]
MSHPESKIHPLTSFFVNLASFSLRRPRLSMGIVGLTVLVSGLIIVFAPLQVSTSRNNLISNDFSYKAREQKFFADFGSSDSMVFVIHGGRKKQRQQAIDKLARQLAQIKILKGRILHRMGPRQVAELLIVREPQLLELLDKLVEKHGKSLLKGDLVSIVNIAKQQIIKKVAENLTQGKPATAQKMKKSYFDPAVLKFTTDFLQTLAQELKKPSLFLPFFVLEDQASSGGRNLDENGYFISPDGKLHFIFLFPQLESDEGSYLAPVIHNIRKQARKVLNNNQFDKIRADLTGQPALAADEIKILNRGIIKTSLLSALGILLLLFIAFRSLRFTVLALVPLAAGVIITLGISQLFYGGLNLVTSSFTSVLMGLGIDFGVHTLYRYGEELRTGRDKTAAMHSALVLAGPGVVTGAITTITAFLCIVTTDFTAYSQLGVITAIGLAVMVVCTFLLIPPLMGIDGGNFKTPARGIPGVTGVLYFVSKFSRWILTGATIAFILSIYLFVRSGPGYDGRYFDFLPENIEARKALGMIENIEGMGVAFAQIKKKSIAEAKKLAVQLREDPLVAKVQTVADIFPDLNPKRLRALNTGMEQFGKEACQYIQSNTSPPVSPEDVQKQLLDLQNIFEFIARGIENSGKKSSQIRKVVKALKHLNNVITNLPDEGRQKLAALQTILVDILQRALLTAGKASQRGKFAPEDVPAVLKKRNISLQEDAVAVYVYPSGDIWDSSRAGKFSRKILKIEPQASGLAVDIQPYEELIISSFMWASLVSVILVMLILLLIFRNGLDTLLAMLPVMLGWVWMLGVMSLFNLDFTAANIVTLPLLFGIGIDAGAHMVHRYRESRKSNKNAKLDTLLKGTGAAVIVAALTTMVAFAALMLADYKAMQSMGFLLTIGIGLCLIASIAVLPALLLVFKKVKKAKPDQVKPDQVKFPPKN